MDTLVKRQALVCWVFTSFVQPGVTNSNIAYMSPFEGIIAIITYIHLLKRQIRSKQVHSISSSIRLPGTITLLIGISIIINFNITQGIMIGNATKIHASVIMTIDTHAMPVHTINNDP